MQRRWLGRWNILLAGMLALHRPAQPPEAADFTRPDLDGRPVRLRDLRGKLVFLNILAVWCPPCRVEMPGMERLYQTFKETAFAMQAVSIDRQRGEVVKPFVEERQLTFPVWLDQKSEVARQYGLAVLVTLLVTALHVRRPKDIEQWGTWFLPGGRG